MKLFQAVKVVLNDYVHVSSCIWVNPPMCVSSLCVDGDIFVKTSYMGAMIKQPQVYEHAKETRRSHLHKRKE